MPETGTSGLMSGDGKRGDGQGPQATAPILDSTVSDMSIAGHRPTILLYNHSISPSRGGDLEQRARRAATGGYSGGGCRGLLPLNRDRRRRHAGATESS